MSGKKSNKSFLSIIVVGLIAAAGAGYYFTKGSDTSDVSNNMPAKANEQAQASEQAAPDEKAVSDVETAAGNATDEAASVPNPLAGDNSLVVEPGNPVVATVDGKDITRVDVYRFIQTMPQNLQKLPATTVYPMAMEQVINTRIVQNKADSADVMDSKEFKHELDIVKQQIARNLYLQKQVDSKITEAKLKDAYKEALKKIPSVEERRARHILVETEAKAKAVLDKLKTGEKFEDLAKSLSVGPTAAKGGDLGYFAKAEMVPEFANAAFGMKKGDVLQKPVKTQFGWHVIKLLDIRQRPKPTFEQLAPMLQAELRREILADLLKNWRKNVKVEQFDINGKPLKKGANATGLVPTKPAAQQGG